MSHQNRTTGRPKNQTAGCLGLAVNLCGFIGSLYEPSKIFETKKTSVLTAKAEVKAAVVLTL